MRTRTDLPLPVSPAEAARGKATGYWGMWGLIATETMLFSILLASYWFLRFRFGPGWPPAGIPKPELLLPLYVMTPLLLLSSAPMHLADRSIRKRNRTLLIGGLLAVFAMGAAFMGLFAVEYLHKAKEFTPQTNVYGSLFYAVTGFHGIHVFVGLMMILWLLFYAARGAFSAERHLAVQLVAMYWHFVDVVWVFVLTTIYLSPHVWP